MKKGVRVVIILAVILVVLAAGGYFAYSRLSGEEGTGTARGFFAFKTRGGGQGNQEEKYSVPVAVTAVRRENTRETLTLYGSVFPQKEVGILTTVNGKAIEIRVEEGDFVQKDQVLAVIDRDQAGLKFAPVEVESTIAGVVKSVLTQEGSTVSPAAPLFQIVDVDIVEVVVDVPEKEIDRVRIGLPVEISVVSYPGRIFSGTVDRLSPVVDLSSRTMETTIRVVNRGYQLKPGMFAEASIILRRKEAALTIPLAALVNKEGRQTVFVVEQERAREMHPQVLFLQGGRAVIESGIEEGDRIVVVGQQSLSDGDEVVIAEVKE